MRTLLFPLAFMAFTLSACAQESGFDKFYNKYKNSGQIDGNISIDPGFLLNASFSSGGNSNEKDGWMHKITRVRVLILDGKKNPLAGEDLKALNKSLRSEQFEELVSVRKGKDNVQLLDKERKDGLKEVVFLATGEDGGGLFIEFRGNFTDHDLEKIQSAIQDNHKVKEETDEQ
jgi:uncharacterized protein DUF4252